MLLLNEITIERGNTVRFLVKFTDFEGNPINPDVTAFKVYDRKHIELSSNEMIKIEPGNTEKTGMYYYFYTPEKDGDYTIELYGLIDNKPSLIRKKVLVVFDGTTI